MGGQRCAKPWVINYLSTPVSILQRVSHSSEHEPLTSTDAKAAPATSVEAVVDEVANHLEPTTLFTYRIIGAKPYQFGTRPWALAFDDSKYASDGWVAASIKYNRCTFKPPNYYTIPGGAAESDASHWYEPYNATSPQHASVLPCESESQSREPARDKTHSAYSSRIYPRT